MKKQKCPRCGTINDDNWPLDIGGKIIEGGCQDCWEVESDRAWWAEIEKLVEAGLLPTTGQS